MTRIAYVVTAPEQVVRLFLRGHLGYLSSREFQVSLISPPDRELSNAATRERIEVWPLPMERDMAPVSDVVALFRLVRILRRIRPSIVNAGTPKGAFLGMLAAYLARVPVRVYHLRALRLETSYGWKKTILAICERIAASASTRIVSISPSLAARYASLGFATADKIVVFGSGSSNGIDANRFCPTDERRIAAHRLRRQLQFGDADFVIGFIGRLIPDKGLTHLFGAFLTVLQTIPTARLLLVGGPEQHHRFEDGFLPRLMSHPRVSVVPYQDDPSPYFHAMNVFAFPSLREGFGNAALEAAASGIPVVGFRVTGVVDAVQDRVTGTLVDPGDLRGLAEAILRYAQSPELLEGHGNAGVAWAAREFRQDVIWDAFAEEYRRLLRVSESPSAG